MILYNFIFQFYYKKKLKFIFNICSIIKIRIGPGYARLIAYVTPDSRAGGHERILLREYFG